MASYSTKELEEIFLFGEIQQGIYHALFNDKNPEFWKKRGGIDGYQRKGNDLSEFITYNLERRQEFIDVCSGKRPVEVSLNDKMNAFYVHVYTLIHSLDSFYCKIKILSVVCRQFSYDEYRLIGSDPSIFDSQHISSFFLFPMSYILPEAFP